MPCNKKIAGRAAGQKKRLPSFPGTAASVSYTFRLFSDCFNHIVLGDDVHIATHILYQHCRGFLSNEL